LSTCVGKMLTSLGKGRYDEIINNLPNKTPYVEQVGLDSAETGLPEAITTAYAGTPEQRCARV
jgi:hypothetical protein